jgi:hypothetical protein
MKRASQVTILALIIFVALGFLGRPNVADTAQPDPKPAPTSVPPPADNGVIANTLASASDKCDPKGGLASKSCKGYRLPETFTNNDALVNIYSQIAGKQCSYNRDYDPANPPMPPDDNPTNYYRCIFDSANNACFKYVQAHNMWGTQQGLPWKPTTIKVGDGSYKCTYCWNGETPTNNPDGKYCANDADFNLDFQPQWHGPYPDVPYFCVNIPVSGPYSNLSDDFTACGQNYSQGVAGAEFTQTQKDDIKALNRVQFSAPANTNRSDLAGFCFPKPPKGCYPGFEVSDKVCKEPDTPLPSSQMQVHHIVPRSAGNSCPCGTNSPKNAMVISAKLNNYFSNKDLATLTNLCDMSQTELDAMPNMPYPNSVLAHIIAHLNKTPKYDVSLLKKIPVVREKTPIKKQIKSNTKKKRRS